LGHQEDDGLSFHFGVSGYQSLILNPGVIAPHDVIQCYLGHAGLTNISINNITITAFIVAASFSVGSSFTLSLQSDDLFSPAPLDPWP
jgi:hypothetical protein